jgi:hypothetical protein
MTVEPPPPAPEDEGEREEPASEKSELDKALEALLVEETQVHIDPTTGQVVEKSSLTDDQDPNRIG